MKPARSLSLLLPGLRRRLLRATVCGALALATACAQQPGVDRSLPGDSGSCDAGTAQIMISDGSQHIICGCEETGGQVIASHTGSLTCTVPAGRTIFFHYIGTQLRHQIIPSGTMTFPPSQISDPSSHARVPSHAFRLDRPGNYAYIDGFDAGLTGTIVVH